MADPVSTSLAEAVLGLHVAVIAFNLLGLVAVPLGAVLGWRWVHVRWWRWLHVASMGAVAVQALLGRACLLTVLQAALAGASGGPEPLIMAFVNRMIFWPLPSWAFATAYVILFLYVLVLLKLVPTRNHARN